jgi:hypothetical protein
VNIVVDVLGKVAEGGRERRERKGKLQGIIKEALV